MLLELPVLTNNIENFCIIAFTQLFVWEFVRISRNFETLLSGYYSVQTCV